jgi:hypothetical protein
VDFGVETAGGGFMWHRDDNYLRFGTNGADRMRILGNGNVGIGSASPAQLLDVAGNIATSGNIIQPANFGMQSTTGALWRAVHKGTVSSASTKYMTITGTGGGSGSFHIFCQVGAGTGTRGHAYFICDYYLNGSSISMTTTTISKTQDAAYLNAPSASGISSSSWKINFVFNNGGLTFGVNLMHVPGNMGATSMSFAFT